MFPHLYAVKLLYLQEVDYKLGYKLEDRLEQLKCDLFGKIGEMQQQFETLRKEIVGRKRSKKVTIFSPDNWFMLTISS